MEDQLIASFKTLIESTARDASLLSSLSKLPDGSHNDLNELSLKIKDVEAKLEEIKAFVSSERAALSLLGQIKKSLCGQEGALSHMASSLPTYLPGAAPSNFLQQQRLPLAPKPAPIQFVTLEELDKVPSATRERSSLDEVNEMLSNLHSMGKEKYWESSVVDREKRKQLQRELDKAGHSAARMVISEKSIVLSNIQKGRGKCRALMSTLRHLGRISMHSTGGETHFLVN